MLEKNKDYIEFSMRTMMVTHKPYQSDAEIGITGLIPDRDFLFGNNPFDIPGEVFVISKRDFEALQTENEQLKKKLEECEKDYRLKRDKFMLLEQEIKIYTKALQDWKEETGYPNPSSAKTAIEAGASWYHAYNETKAANKKLADDVKSWRNATGYSTPEGFLSAMINNKAQSLYSWQKETGCSTPDEAKELIDGKKRHVTKLQDELNDSQKENERSKEKYDQAIEMIGEWQQATGHFLPKAADEELTACKEVTGCKTIEEAKNWVAEMGEANGNLAQAVLSWQDATGCNSPEVAKCRINALINEATDWADNYNHWLEITGFSTPEKCSSYIDTLEKKLEDIKNLIEED